MVGESLLGAAMEAQRANHLRDADACPPEAAQLAICDSRVVSAAAHQVAGQQPRRELNGAEHAEVGGASHVIRAARASTRPSTKTMGVWPLDSKSQQAVTLALRCLVAAVRQQPDAARLRMHSCCLLMRHACRLLMHHHADC